MFLLPYKENLFPILLKLSPPNSSGRLFHQSSCHIGHSATALPSLDSCSPFFLHHISHIFCLEKATLTWEQQYCHKCQIQIFFIVITLTWLVCISFTELFPLNLYWAHQVTTTIPFQLSTYHSYFLFSLGSKVSLPCFNSIINTPLELFNLILYIKLSTI